MTRTRLRWGLGTIAACGLYLFKNNGGTRFLLAFLLFLPLFSLLTLLVRRKKATLTLSLPESGQRGEPLPLSLTFPEPGEVRLLLKNRYSGETLSLKTQTSGPLPFALPHYGLWEVTCTAFRLHDPLGLFALNRPVPAGGRVLVPPPVYPMAVSLREREAGLPEAERWSLERPGADPSETFRIREYLPGDSPRQIHWKLSEKVGKTLVRDFGLPEADAVLLLLGEERREADGVLELLVSLSAALTAQELPHRIGARRIALPGDLEALLPALLGEPWTAVSTAGFAHLALLSPRYDPEAERLGAVPLVPGETLSLEELHSGRLQVEL